MAPMSSHAPVPSTSCAWSRRCKEGRTIYDNLRKAILFILPTNGAQGLAIVAAVVLGLVLPLTPVQILWVNMVVAVTLALSLPFTEAFARGMEPLLPKRGPRLTQHLDNSLLAAPPVALEATRRTLTDATLELADQLAPLLDSAVTSVAAARRHELAAALDATQHFFARIRRSCRTNPGSRLRASQVHAIDHLARLVTRTGLPDPVRRALSQPQFEPLRARCAMAIDLARKGLSGQASGDWLAAMEAQALAMTGTRGEERLAILGQAAHDERSPAEAMAALDALRWVERVTHHLWRASSYLTAASATPDTTGVDGNRTPMRKGHKAPDEGIEPVVPPGRRARAASARHRRRAAGGCRCRMADARSRHLGPRRLQEKPAEPPPRTQWTS